MKSYTMLSIELLDYLRKCKEQLVPFEEITASLKENKWDDLTIAEAQAWYRGNLGDSSSIIRSPTLADVEHPKGLIYHAGNNTPQNMDKVPSGGGVKKILLVILAVVIVISLAYVISDFLVTT